MWVRGLKLDLFRLHYRPYVAPYVGAWIETNSLYQNRTDTQVAPYVGAWIETILRSNCTVI